jgi:ABC-type sugar transport system ATPase subunit
VLILSGIILSGFFAALVSLMQYLADTEEVLPNIVFWLLGSFATANWHKVALVAGPVLAAALLLFALRWRINLLSLDEKDARALGVSMKPLRRGVLVCCALLVAAQVAVSGSIAWVGLMIPHLARLLVGADHRRLLPALGGKLAVEGGVSVVPQSFRPAFAWQVQEVVLMGRTRHIALFAQPSADDQREVMQALTQLNISHLARQSFSTLSGGQQLVMIARALAISPAGTLNESRPPTSLFARAFSAICGCCASIRSNSSQV